MAGDRSGYHHLYPKVLSFTEADAQRILSAGIPQQADPEDYKKYVHGLAEDVQRIRDGVTMIAWPNPDNRMIDIIKAKTLEICLFRLGQISQVTEAQKGLADALKPLGITREGWSKQFAQFPGALTDEELSLFKMVHPDWEEVFLVIPAQRRLAAENWKIPFDAVDAAISEDNFPVLDYLLNEMHSRITRGHNWFGVGEWNIANRQYLTALAIAISTNNCAAIETIVRFLVDTYVAAGDSQSTVNITNDFLDSPAYQQSPYKEMTAEMLEAIAVTFALAKRLDESQEWIKKIPILCKRVPHAQVSEWNIIQLLTDVHKFRQNSSALFAVNSAVREISGLL